MKINIVYLMFVTIILLIVTSFMCLRFLKKLKVLNDRYTRNIVLVRLIEIDGRVNRCEITWDQSTVERNDVYKEAALFYNLEKVLKLMLRATLIGMGILIILYGFGKFVESKYALQIGVGIGTLMALSELLYMKLAYGKLVQIFEDNEGKS